MNDKTHIVAYRYWQDRATPFYLAARILYENKNTPEASAFCAYQAIENILKGALEFHKMKCWGHCLVKLTKKLSGKINIEIPDYLDDYQEVSRYPYSSGNRGSALTLNKNFLTDLDRIMYEVISNIPDKGDTRLKKLIEKNNGDILELSENNDYIDKLRDFYKE